MLKIGIFFGGKSREREVSFAGGRTVYDALDKSVFEPIPIFIDGLGNFIELDWQYVYKGTIRDFFPPSGFSPISEHNFQIYSESLGEKASNPELLNSIGNPIPANELQNKIDFAFLALHGPYGEDGSIQGLLDYYNIPYSGSGIYSSSVGISKALQKRQMKVGGFAVNRFITFSRAEFDENPDALFKRITSELEFPVVVKASSQGSSIGVHFLNSPDFIEFCDLVSKSLFRIELTNNEWNAKNANDQIEWVRQVTDLQHGLGLPLLLEGAEILTADNLLTKLGEQLNGKDAITLESIFAEPEIVVEEKIVGKEFSCIVLRDDQRNAVALPPTEIRKKNDLFDYRSKYLPGITRKVTPIEIPDQHIENIRTACEELFEFFGFNVYARIDGFVNDQGEVFLNDPNTTSGMMPSSFFFHQAAEIGLTPTQFLSYIIHQSLLERENQSFQLLTAREVRNKLENGFKETAEQKTALPKVGVFFGGYSSERHISVESGRNVFEKLSSSGKYETIPIFLTKDSNDQIRFYKVPINILLKDNADDIKEKIENFKIVPVVNKIIEEARNIGQLVNVGDYDFYPKELTLSELKGHIDFAFMALHGRPGEDGTLPEMFEKEGIPYNGSPASSASVTIDKYVTNERLKANGIEVAEHQMTWKEQWQDDLSAAANTIEKEFGFPLIAKPADDGCSSAVKKIDDPVTLQDFAATIFRENVDLTPEQAAKLNLKVNEEFPIKKGFLVEELIDSKGADRFLEITGGLLTHIDSNGEMRYEMFEASEAVAEGGILSLEEKFLAGEGQNITPARYAPTPEDNAKISSKVKNVLEKTAKTMGVEGYCRIDAFVRIYSPDNVEVVVIEINSLPGLTPATAIFHQAALANYKPFEFLEKIIEFGIKKKELAHA